METEGPVLFVLENAFFQFAPLNIQVGDLFLTQEHICFVPYTIFISTGKVGVAAGALMGGLAGGAAASLTEKNYRDAALERANNKRKQLWGMNLSERMKLSANAIAISRNDISEFKVDKNTISLRTGQSHINKLTDYEDKLSKWRLGGLIDLHGCAVTSKHLAPALAFEALFAGNQSQDFVDELNTASSDKDYMEHLWAAFELLPKERRHGVIEELQRFAGPFPNAFAKFRKSAIASGKDTFIIGSIALVVAALSGVYLAIRVMSAGDQPSTAVDFISMLVFFSSLIFGLIRISKGFRAIRM